MNTEIGKDSCFCFGPLPSEKFSTYDPADPYGADFSWIHEDFEEHDPGSGCVCLKGHRMWILADEGIIFGDSSSLTVSDLERVFTLARKWQAEGLLDAMPSLYIYSG